MSYFAQLDSNNVVIRVVVADQAFINTGKLGDPASFIETFIDGRATGRRKNYAAIGYTYNAQADAFYAPKPTKYPSWVLDANTGTYKPPVDMPTLPLQAPFVWEWDEPSLSWIQVRD